MLHRTPPKDDDGRQRKTTPVGIYDQLVNWTKSEGVKRSKSEGGPIVPYSKTRKGEIRRLGRIGEKERPNNGTRGV